MEQPTSTYLKWAPETHSFITLPAPAATFSPLGHKVCVGNYLEYPHSKLKYMLLYADNSTGFVFLKKHN